jgi:AraC family transcriptional activator of pobA
MTPQPFTIFLRTEDELKEIATLPNEPHHHDFEELIIVTEGMVEHFIDFKKKEFEAPLVSFVTKGKVHRVNVLPKDGKRKLWGVRFKSEFIPEITFQLYSFYHDHANIPLRDEACFARITTLCQLMLTEMATEVPDYSVIRPLLNALFMMIEAERKKNAGDEILNQKSLNTTFKKFLGILEENFRRPEGVEFYAEKLNMSSRNLNLICRNILQQSVTELIETRKLIEAKNLLVTTDKTVSEVGFELGFKEKALFTAVFKRKSGQTPTEFRNEIKKQIS